MRISKTLIVGLALVLAAGAVYGAETVAVERVEGKVSFQSAADGAVRPAALGSTLRKGDVVTLDDGGSATLLFADGARLDLSGPGAIRFRMLNGDARTVELIQGTINRFIVKQTTTGIMAVCDSYVALSNGTVFVRSEVGEKKHRAIFKLFEGGDAQIGEGDVRRALTVGTPVVVECDCCERGYEDLVGDAAAENKQKVIRLGEHLITLDPPEAFTIVKTADGGLLITSNVLAGQFGVVTLDDYTTFYLGSGQTIRFGPDGSVNGHTGIIHIYGPLDRRGLYDSPDPSSFSGTSER